MSCNIDNKAWYNWGMQSVFYSKNSFLMNQYISFEDKYSTFIDSQVSGLVSILETNINEDPFNYDFKKEGIKFDKLYSVKKTTPTGVIRIIATLDENHLIVMYDGADAEKVCKVVDHYNFIKTDKPHGIGESPTKIDCMDVSGKPYIIAYGFIGAEIDPDMILADLTGKLRLE